MTRQARALVCVVMAGAVASLYSVHAQPGRRWMELTVYLVAILISSNMKVPMPKSNGTMSVNFPFILLGIMQLAPAQAVLLAVASVIALCRVKVVKAFTLVQILFNIANVTTATALACHTYAASLRWMHGETAPALTTAVIVYFFANTIPLALVLGWESGTSPLRQWRDEFPWYFPFYLVGAMLAALANRDPPRPGAAHRGDRGAAGAHHRRSGDGHRGEGQEHAQAPDAGARVCVGTGPD